MEQPGICKETEVQSLGSVDVLQVRRVRDDRTVKHSFRPHDNHIRNRRLTEVQYVKWSIVSTYPYDVRRLKKEVDSEPLARIRTR